jgi:23S rRNA pseudouridine1911/1915/1917 synthase
LLVVNKPVGLTVHPGAGRHDGTLVNMLLGHTDGKLSDVGTQERPGIVHRLDKDTSGLLMVAKTNRVHVALADALQRRDIQRHYQALVWGLPQPLSGTIDAPIGRDPKEQAASGDYFVRQTCRHALQGSRRDGHEHCACRLQVGNRAHAPNPCPYDVHRPSAAGR